MNKVTLLVSTLLSVGIGLVVNFLILRAVMRKVHKPQDQQQSRLAAVLAVLFSVPSVVRIKQLAEIMETQPVERQVGR
jgi:hypothetical protein